jgi:multiple sugar transport system permease protein
MFVISFLKWGGFLSRPTFAAFDNYQRVFSDPQFFDAARNTAVHIALVVPIMMVLSFMLGYYVSLNPRGHRLLRVVLFAPALLSLAALGTVFYAVFQPTGLINSILDGIGLGEYSTPWLASPATALGTIVAVNLWSGIGFTAVLFAARFTSVSRDVFEAAELDGAGHWTKMWRIAFPITRDYFGVLTMLQFLWNLFSSAGTVLLLTKGGPGTASTTLSYLVYVKGFVNNQVGYSQTVGVVLFVLGVIGLLAIRRMFRQDF